MEGDVYKDHKTRRLLFDYISENPGSTFKVIKSALKITDSTLRYHLLYLQRRRKIVQEKKGRENCYFSFMKKRFPFTDPNVKLNNKQEKILQLISLNPVIQYSDLQKKSGMDKASFSYNLKKLKKMKIIWRVKKNEKIGYEIVTKEQLANEMFLVLVNKYLNGEVEKSAMMEIIEKLRDYREE